MHQSQPLWIVKLMLTNDVNRALEGLDMKSLVTVRKQIVQLIILKATSYLANFSDAVCNCRWQDNSYMVELRILKSRGGCCMYHIMSQISKSNWFY